MNRLDGKVALITGAAHGQGAAEARLFASAGATVIATDIDADAGNALAAEVGATFYAHDVADAAAWQRIVDDVIAAHGRIDVLVNNAGIFHVARLVETSDEEFARIMAVNQTGVFLGMRTVARPMCDAGGGSIVNISSVAGLEGAAGAFAYSASKWAVRGMTRTAAHELGRFGVRVNSVHPGFIDTEMLQQTHAAQAGKMDRALRMVPLGRAAEADEVARLVLFLASDESSYCSGGEYTVDGGLMR